MKHFSISRCILGFLIAASAVLSSAAEAQTIGLHVASVHSAPGFNNDNPGVYLRLNDGAVAGSYYNSERKQSYYAAYTWKLASFKACSADVVTGAITGYAAADVIPLVVPSVACAITGGLAARLTFIPKVTDDGAAALHLSFEYSF